MSDPITRLNTALEGRYRIERQLGEGGMATVYLARDEKHNRNVALKVLKPELAAVVGAERFLAEIETTANLQHPHILPLFDSGEADGFLFYVMPFVEGESVRERLDRERQLPVDGAVRIAAKVAAGLQVAHDQGVIHRDIKPANILLSKGEPVVSDFGIALALGAAGGGRVTETGLSLGTPHYMSPEQATGDMSVGAATDVYALGCVLYEMLVGEPPYTGSTPQAVLGKIVTGNTPSARDQRKSISANVDAAIRKALEMVPADRFATARDMAVALEDRSFRYGEPVGRTRVGNTRAWKVATAGAGAVAVLFGTLWGLGRSGTEAPRPLTTYVEVFPPGQEMSGAFEGEMAMSPDGERFVYRGPGTQLLVRERSSLTGQPIEGTEGGVEPFFSPDGERVAFATQSGQLKVASFTGEPVRTLVPGDLFPAGVAWGSDGYIYFVTQSHLGVLRIAEDGSGEPEAVTSLEPGDIVHRGPDPLPDGNGLIFWIEGGERVGLIDFRTGERRVLAKGRSPRYVPSGHLIYVSTVGELMAAPFRLDQMELTGPALPVRRGLTTDRGSFVISQSGRLAYLANAGRTGRQLVWVDRDGVETPVGPSTVGPFFGSVRVSPQGTHLATWYAPHVWIINLDGAQPHQLTLEGVRNTGPEWSADGQFVSYVSSDGDLFRRPIDQSVGGELLWDEERPIAQGLVTDEWFVLTLRDSAGEDLYAVLRSDGSTLPLAAAEDADERAPALSPEGRLVAYVSNSSGVDEVYVRSLSSPDGRSQRISQGGGVQPAWASNGTELFYVNAANQLVVVPVTTEPSFDVLGPPDPLFSIARYLDPPNHVHYDVDPDDQRFAMIRSRASAVPDRLIVVENFLQELSRLLPVD